MNTGEIVQRFTYRKWSDQEVEKYRPLRAKAMEYALLIDQLVPDCPEKEQAILEIHRISMLVNLACTMHPLE